MRRIRRAGGAGAEAALDPRALKWRRVVVVVVDDSRTRCVLGVSAPRGATPRSPGRTVNYAPYFLVIGSVAEATQSPVHLSL